MVRIELHCRILTPPMFELMQSAQLDDLFRPFSAESIDENGRYPCIIL